MIKQITQSIAVAGVILINNMTPGPGLAQSETNSPSPTKSSKTYGDWIVNCAQIKADDDTTKQVCDMSQTLTQNNTGKRVLTFTVVPQDDGFAMVILTPFGLDLSKGIIVKANDVVLLEHGFRTCMPNGCIVRAPLTDDITSALTAAETAVVTLFDLNGTAVDINISTNGFSDALANMNEK